MENDSKKELQKKNPLKRSKRTDMEWMELMCMEWGEMAWSVSARMGKVSFRNGCIQRQMNVVNE